MAEASVAGLQGDLPGAKATDYLKNYSASQS